LLICIWHVRQETATLKISSGTHWGPPIRQHELVISLITYPNRPPLPVAVQLSETHRDEYPAIFYDPPNFPPEILDDTIFMIATDPLDIPADVLDDVDLVPVSMCTPEVDAKVLGGTAVVQMLSAR
jgi:hypothetical protein